MVGPQPEPGRRAAGVRLQLDRDGTTTSYSAGEIVDEATVLAGAPNLDIAGSHVRLDGSQLPHRARAAGRIGHAAARRRARPVAAAGDDHRRARLDHRLHRAGAVGTGRRQSHDRSASRWHCVMRRAITITTGDSGKACAGNGDRWRAAICRSSTAGSFRPPMSRIRIASRDFSACSARKERIGFSTAVSLEETGDVHGVPQRSTVRARGQAIDLELAFTVDRTVRTAMAMTAAPGAAD